MGAQYGQRCRPKSTTALSARPELRRDLDIARSLKLTRGQFYALPEDELEDWIADWELEQGRCKFHGGPIDECADDERDWFPQRHICWPTAQLAAASRLYDMRHEDNMAYHDGHEQIWSDKPSKVTPFHYLDGVTIYLAETDENPEDKFLGE